EDSDPFFERRNLWYLASRDLVRPGRQPRFELDPVRRGAGSSYLYTDYDTQGRAVEIGKTTGSFASANPDAATTGTKTAYHTFAHSGSQLLEASAPGAAIYRYGYDANGRVGSIVADMTGLGAKQIDYVYDNA